MEMPASPVTLNVEQIAELNQKLANLRHDVNNNLLLIMASAELIRVRPASTEMAINNLLDQPTKITDAMSRFSREFEQMMGLKRP